MCLYFQVMCMSENKILTQCFDREELTDKKRPETVSIYLSIHLSIYLSITYLSVSILSICLSIYPSSYYPKMYLSGTIFFNLNTAISRRLNISCQMLFMFKQNHKQQNVFVNQLLVHSGIYT